MSLLARRRNKASINIIPLMDVLTILIFFFLVSMQFKEMTTLNLTLPKIESAG
jgi:biopolymer transport protein ExbD